jgi:hypothetical protein
VDWLKDSWNYQLLDSEGETFPLRNTVHCQDLINTPDKYEIGNRLILTFTCKSLPRPLKTGDRIKVMNFVDKSGK